MVSAKVFCFIYPDTNSDFGIMFLIPYIREVRETISGWDIIMLLFYMLLLVGNISLFYAFSRYSQMLEESMFQRLSQVRYEVRKQGYDKAEMLDERYKRAYS